RARARAPWGKRPSGQPELRENDEVVAMDDLVRDALGEVTGSTPRDRAQSVAGHARQTLGERPPVLADHLDGVVGVEPAVDVANTGREQRAAVARQRPTRAVVDCHPAGRAAGERGPQA